MTDLEHTCLSTMWGVGRFERLSEFFAAGWQLGFRAFELNHQVDSAMLNGLDPKRYPVASLHEPCPADISTGELKAHNWLVSSRDEEQRRQGVLAVQRSIDLAQAVGARLIVVHPGKVDLDMGLETSLRALFEAGQAQTSRYAGLKAELAAARAAQVGANLEAVQRSLAELAEYAGRAGIRLGLENRYHYLEIPLLDELGVLLDRLDAERVGFWYDVGHAQTLDRLGFDRHRDWLERYARRMVGVHLHDIRGIHDHLAAGLGEADWGMVASYLPHDALRTCEFHSTNSPQQVAAGARLLAERGCLATPAAPQAW